MRIASAILFTFLCLPAHAVELVDPLTPSLKGYKVTFSDEFQGKDVDYRKWKTGINGSNAIQRTQHSPYVKENATLKNGKLVLTTRREVPAIKSKVYGGGKPTFDYSGGGLNTEDLYYIKGDLYIEIRCKLPENPGGYVAFWTMPAKRDDGKGMRTEDKVETDFFEFKTNIAKAGHYRYFSSLWWHHATANEVNGINKDLISKRDNGEYWLSDKTVKLHTNVLMKKPLVDFSKAFTMGFKATKGKLSWHISQEGSAFDKPAYMTYKRGTVTGKVDKKSGKAAISATRPVPKLNNYLILNYRVSNDAWLGGPIDDAKLPATAEFDYIRVYNKL